MSGKYTLRYSTLTTLVLLTTLLVSACGGAPAVDATLPTLVPTYSPAAAGAAATTGVAESTATAAPAATPTDAPTVAPTETPSPEPTDAPTAPPTSAPTDTPAAAPTATAAPAITPTIVISATTPADLQGTTNAGNAVGAASALTGTTAMTATAGAPLPTSLLPADLTAALATADPVHGQELTVANGCIACHALGEGQVLVGPSWYGVGAYAATRVAGETAEEYLYRSIVAPNDHLVEGFIAGLMPQVYGDTIATADLADIISYLLSLQ